MSETGSAPLRATPANAPGNASGNASGNAAGKTSDDQPCARPYHHGDLSRALVTAGRRILEAEGPAAMSLRAVAREAGVSPAAPYHHFKDKGELLDAVAEEGWHELGQAMAKVRASAASAKAAMTELGVAYVRFARENPALYRLMYHAACNRAKMPDRAKDEDSAWRHVEEALIEAGADPMDAQEMQLAQIAAWCNVHGIAEMAGFQEFAALREALGGEEAFVRAILQHVSIFGRRPAAPGD
jgi:AcrR family transcriptional regulator